MKDRNSKKEWASDHVVPDADEAFITRVWPDDCVRLLTATTGEYRALKARAKKKKGKRQKNTLRKLKIQKTTVRKQNTIWAISNTKPIIMIKLMTFLLRLKRNRNSRKSWHTFKQI